jgi:hypothetical protein
MGGLSGGNLLLAGETEGFAIDATISGGSVSVIDTGTPANDLDNVALNAFTFDDATLAAITGSNIANSGTSPKLVGWNADPYVRSTPHNMLQQSQTFDNVAWTKTRSSIGVNATTAPDGTSTADSLIEDGTAASTHVCTYASNIMVVGLIYNVSVYAKALGSGSARYLQFNGIGLGGASEVPNFDIVNGTVDLPATSVYCKSCTITSVGSGWYRCSMVVAANNVSAVTFQMADDSTNNTGDSYSGDSASGMYLWGAQTTQGAYLHPYHATTGAAWYGVAQEYDGTQFGVLTEPAATNLCLRSEEFDNAYWTKGLTATANNTTAPDGISSAETFATDGATARLVISSTITVSASTVYTASCYVKSTDHDWIRFEWTDVAFSHRARVWFNLSTGAKGSSAVVGSGVVTDYNIEALGNNWYRCWVAGSISTVTSGAIQILGAAADASNTAAATSRTIALWGAQVELGSAPTSYTPTSAATATRAADAISCATSTYPHSATEGAFVVWFTPRLLNSSAVFEKLVGVSDGTTNERMNLNIDVTGSPDTVSWFIADGGATQVGSLTSAISLSGNKVAGAYKANDCGVVLDGGAETTDVSATLPTVTTFDLGHASEAASRQFNGYIHQMTYIPRRLTEAEMQTKTT